MPTQITNQASLAFNYGTTAGSALSNVATTTLLDPISADKTAVAETYRAGSTITYVLSLQNNGTTPLSSITVTDNLGTYSSGGVSNTPLTYANGAVLYINGVYSGPITAAVAAQSVTFTIDTLAPDANALIVYNATVNEYAPLASGSTIVNTATFAPGGLITPISESATVTVQEYADVSILKEMSPDSVSEGDTLTYTFTVNNYGNTAATDVVLTDQFDLAPSLITVSVDGQAVSSSDYTYTGGLLRMPTGTGYSMTIPAATITQDPTTGVVTTTPGTLTIRLVGTI